MTFEAFYGDDYPRLLETQRALTAIAGELEAAGRSEEDLQPIVYSCSRIKRPESMRRKLASRGLPDTRAAALEEVYDAVGLRIICSFAGDVMHVVESLEHDPRLTVHKKKDYLYYPKPNGYRSIHLCVRTEETGPWPRSRSGPSPWTSGRPWSTS